MHVQTFYGEWLQLGMGVPNSNETIAREASLWLSEKENGQLLFQVDISNAFNSLDRASMLESIRVRAPHFFAYAHAFYGSPSLMFHPHHPGWSQQGVQCIYIYTIMEPANKT